MKIFKNEWCHSVAGNDKYFCIIYNKIKVYAADDLRHICTFSDMVLYYHAEFIDENKFVVKNGQGIFKIYDIERAECIKTFKVGQIQKYAQDSIFILSPQKDYIIDVITNKDFDDVWLCKIEIATGNIEHVRINYDIRVIKNLTYDKKTDKVNFLNQKAVGEINGELKSAIEVFETDLTKMQCRVIYSSIVPINMTGVLFYDNKYILNENMEIIDILTNKVQRRVDCAFEPYYMRQLFRCFLYDDNKYLVMLTGRGLLIIDFINGNTVYEYRGGSCPYAYFFGQTILFGAENKIMIDENPLLKQDCVK